MKSEFEKYLKAINATFVLIAPVEQCIARFEEFSGEEPTDILLSEDSVADGSIRYVSLWVFSKNFTCEMRNPFNAPFTDFDFCRTAGNIHYFRVWVSGASGDKSPDDVRLEGTFRGTSAFDMHATGANTQYLLTIIKKYFLAGLM